MIRRSRKRLSRPVKLTDLIGSHARRWRFVHLHRLEVIREKWKIAAGEYVAHHVVPVRLVRKTLRVAAIDSNWLSEMTYLIDPILKRLQELLPGKWVEEIRVVQGGPSPEVLPDRRELPFSLPPINQAMEQEANRLCQQIQDPDLAQAIQKATISRRRRLVLSNNDNG